MTKTTTCALAVMHGTKILIALPTNGAWLHGWSLPKGIMDPGETYAQAALRECFEETGLDFRDREAELIDLGLRKYRPYKDYHLSLLKVLEPVNPAVCVCESMFIHKEQEFPEVCEFDFVELEVAITSFLNKGQADIVNELIFKPMRVNT